jgi:hypothetical protein
MTLEDGFQVKILICCECGEEFVFTVKAQQYFAERGYTEDPKRCKYCHTRFKKAQREGAQRRGVEFRPVPDLPD